jgi:hypothetical protein
MSDNIPGSSPENPIQFQGWLIYAADAECGPMSFLTHHADYTDMHASDERIAYVESVDAAKRFIEGWNLAEVAPQQEKL